MPLWISRSEKRLGDIQLDAGDFGVGIDEGLLVDAANTFERTDLESILRALIAGMDNTLKTHLSRGLQD